MTEPVNQNASDQMEADLIAAAQSNPQAFEALYLLYIQPVFRYLYSRIGSLSAAEDAVAQTFLAALEGFDRYRHNGHFAAWLFSIARRKAVDYFRKQRGLVSLEHIGDISFEPNLLQEVIRTERVEKLQHLISGLSEYEHELLRLRYIAELSFSEISRLLGRSEGAVKKTLYRLLARLKSQVEDSND